MTSPALHSWHLAPEEAARVQVALRRRLLLKWDGRPVRTIAGVDVGLTGTSACAAIVLLRFPALDHQETARATASLDYPYIPGLLAFREAPAILAAWENLHQKPDLLLFDGQGIAHPRGLGIASHLGIWFDCPSIGVAKTHLYGRYQDPGPERGDCAWLYDERESQQVIGAVLRTRSGAKPVFISPGHLIDLPSAIRFILTCCLGFRLPEPIRVAHRVAGEAALHPASGW